MFTLAAISRFPLGLIINNYCLGLLLTLLCYVNLAFPQQATTADQPNIVFILTDDHRYDALGFLGHPFLETPHLDQITREGAFVKNAFVTTSLCSPSRASILTGLYAHNHQVVDNYNPISSDLKIFPQYLQQVGYETAFIGKWHMGDTDEPRPGFDYWLSFKGQGTYWPDGRGTSRKVPQNNYTGFNINGKKVPQKGYITDELTDYALAWLQERPTDKPFMLYVSHKAVHSDFVAANRHLGRYKDEELPKPVTYENSEATYGDKPMWLKNQRNSRHGVDYAYNLEDFNLDNYYQRYTESLLAVDENVGRIMDYLHENKLKENTIFIYMGDNGFHFGEQGLIDKRTAYEASIRVPLLMMYPKIIEPGSMIEEMVANIDIAPTLLDIADAEIPPSMDGRSFLPFLKGADTSGLESLLYEYYWENNYPYTPTTFALRTDDYKYIHYYGIWDIDELYDIKNDPQETTNLIHDTEYQTVVQDLKKRLAQKIQETGGNQIPFLRERGKQYPMRKEDGAEQAPFPNEFYKDGR
jgi:N-acetylglucosamine-6-sulfatase